MLGQLIYKRGSKGEIRTWQFEFNKTGYRTHTGVLNGKITTSAWRLTPAKSQNTDADQAAFEALAAEEKKLRTGYHREIDAIDTGNPFKPMLAKKYEGTTFPCASQPKLDGIRCVFVDGLPYTRTGKLITSIPHIVEAMQEVLKALPKGAVVDGELYNHELRSEFSKITSLVRKSEPTEEGQKLIQYHIYDMCVPDRGFIDRYSELGCHIFPGGPLVVVPTHIVTAQAQLDSLFSEYLDAKYEGQMVRSNTSEYENKRSSFLLKRKKFITEEFRILGWELGSGNWAGAVKVLKCETADKVPFEATMTGTYEDNVALVDTIKEYVGGVATVRFFELTDTNQVPRFGVVTDINKGERDD